MTRLFGVVCMALCLMSLLSGMAWADGGTASNPVVGPDVPLFIPTPQEKRPPFDCWLVCAGNYSTSFNGGASDWGMGLSCDEAYSSFSEAVTYRANNSCPQGACQINEVITGGCFFNGTMFQVDGYATYGCVEQQCLEYH